MKHLREEKIGFGIEIKKISLILLLFLSTNIYPQIPINGFCKFSNFKIDTSFNLISVLNFNEDSYADLLLISSSTKRASLFEGTINGGFSLTNSFTLPFNVVKFIPLQNKNNGENEFVYISRKNRKTGIFKISSNGEFTDLINYEFKSFPNNICAGDINYDGNNEILISGSAFDGLSILFFDGKEFYEEKIDSGTSYTDAILTDLNNDEFLDIAAFNLFSNSIVFFYNNGDSSFRNARVEPTEGKINFFKSFDMNMDNYEDIVFTMGSSIQIFYNDFQSSFNKNIIINTDYFPDKLILGDFNQDGKIDIAYLNFGAGIFSIIFAKNEISFFPEIIYLQKSGLSDGLPFYSKYLNGICGVSSSGEFFLITKFVSFFENTKISIAGKPSAISYFDFDNNGINDLAFIDDFNNSLNILIRNSSGVPDLFYSFSLFHPQNELAILDIDSKTKAFYCFSLNKKLIETLVIDFISGKINRKSIYAEGNIKDIKIKKADGIINIFACYKNGNKLGINIFEYMNKEYFLKNKFEFDAAGISPELILNKKNSVYFWRKEENKIALYEKIFEEKSKSIIQRFYISLKDTFQIVSTEDDLLNQDKNILVSFVKPGGPKAKTFAVLASEDFSFITQRNNSDEINIFDRSQLFTGEMRFNGLKKLFIYNPVKKIVNRIDFFNGGKNYVAFKVADLSNLPDQSSLNKYFIKNMNFKKYHLVFTRKNESFITVKTLSN